MKITLMKKITLLFLLLVLFACKSPEEKLHSKLTDSAKTYISNITNSEIYDINIIKIDTVTEKRELNYIHMLLELAAKDKKEQLQYLKHKWDEYSNNYKAYANYDNTNYWKQKENESFIQYNKLKNTVSILDNKSIEFKEKSKLNNSKKALGLDVNFSFKSKDKSGAISSVNYSLPFSLSGDLLDQENVNLNIFKKYKAEHLLLYLTE